jgi:hypothetical protein
LVIGVVTRNKARGDRNGRILWHCPEVFGCRHEEALQLVDSATVQFSAVREFSIGDKLLTELLHCRCKPSSLQVSLPQGVEGEREKNAYYNDDALYDETTDINPLRRV